MNEIWIRGLRVSTHIGLTEGERSQPQQIEIDVAIEPRSAFSEMHDDISHTVDYAFVIRRIESLAIERPRNLLETFATEISQTILREFEAKTVTVEIRKFILPQTNHVAVRYRESKHN